MDGPVQEGKFWGEGVYPRWASGGLGQPKGTEKVQTRGKWEGGASPGSLGDQLCDLRETMTLEGSQPTSCSPTHGPECISRLALNRATFTCGG